jgi:hypothetical protein
VPAFDAAKAQAAVAATYKSNPLSLVPVAAGPVLLVLSVIPLWYRVHSSYMGVSDSDLGNAWHGPLPILGVLLALAASVLLLGRMLSMIPQTLPVDLIAAGVFALALIFFVISLFVLPGMYGDVKSSISGYQGAAAKAAGIKVGASSFLLAWLAVPITAAAAYIAAMPVLKARKQG